MRRLPERHPDRLPKAFWVGELSQGSRPLVEGLTAEGPMFAGLPLAAPRLVNPPGRDELHYRVGTYHTFLADMLHHVETQRIPDGPHRGTAPLARLSIEEPGNWVLALFHAWAVVGEVLSFYQERIANEGYLRTATEPLSLRELLYTIGYVPYPGAAAVTHLSFKVSAARGMPEEVTLTRGARVQSLPVAGRPVQLFETDEALSARSEWNRIEPRVATVLRRPPLTGASTGVKLTGLRAALDRGASLLVVATLDGVGPRRWWRTVEKAKRLPAGRRSEGTLEQLLATRARDQGTRKASATEVSWGEPLDSGHATAELRSPQVFKLRRRGSLFGHNAPDWDKLPLEVQREARPIRGGVALTTDGGESWRQANQGLPSEPVHVLASGADGLLFAATQSGLYRAVADGPWKALDGFGRQAVEAVATDGKGSVWAATTTGGVLRSGDGGDTWEPVAGHRPTGPVGRLAGRVFRRPPRQVRLPRGPVHTLAVIPTRRGALLLAGTDKGIYSTRDRGDGWRPLNRGLPGADAKTGLVGLAVHALAADGGGALWAGTAKGVFRAGRPGRRWHPASQGLPGLDPKTGLAATPVLALAAYDDRRARRRRLAAATPGGVFHRSGTRGTWRPTGEGLPATASSGGSGGGSAPALAVRADPQTLTTELWAATGAGLFRSPDHGETWVPTHPDGSAASATAVTVGPLGEVVAASPFAGFSEDEWPGFHLRGRVIDLASVVPEIVPGGWLVLTESLDEGPPRVGIYCVESASAVRRQDFRLDAMVTRVVVESGEGLETFDLRRTVVHSVSEELELWSEEVPLLEPLDPEEIEVGLLSSPLALDRAVIVTGRPLRLTLAPGAPPATLVPREEGAPPTPIQPGEVLTLTAPPPPQAERQEGRTTLAVRHPDAGNGELEVASGDVRWLPAAEDAEPVAQLTRVAGFTQQAVSRQTSPEDEVLVSRVALDPPLVHGLDPATSALLANVARASQGETVVEHLNGGGVARPHRSLVLAKGPLTWLPAATPDGVLSTLDVRVGGSRWQEVRSLREAGSQDRVFIVRRDLTGRPHLVFGDDREGARLPRGHGNVEVTYRRGMWIDPLPAGHLNLLQTRPLGLQGVTNPLPTGGATPPELPLRGRTRAPRAARALGRIVSLPDCEDFVASFPGVARTCLARLATSAGPLIQLTIAGPRGRPVEGTFLEFLTESVASNRLPGPRVRIDSYRRVALVVAARLLPAPDALAGPLEERVSAHLRARLGFARARFGQTLTASEIVTMIQEVPGVVEVELTAFHAADAPPTVADALRAAPAAWTPSDRTGGTVHPAQLLILDESDGLRLEVIPRS